MRYRFQGSIPSKKNAIAFFKGRMINSKDYREFLKSFEHQVRKNYPQLFIIIKALPRPIHTVLHITRWRDDAWDFDNKMTTIQDAMTKIGLIPNDSYKTFLPFPGDLKCDKGLSGAEEDFFELEFIKGVEFDRFKP